MIEERTKKGISRRDFIKGTGLAVGGVAISSTVLGAACNPAPTANNTPPVIPSKNDTSIVKPPPDGQKPTETPVVHGPEGIVTLNVNNRKVVLQVQPEWSLAFVLREKLGLVGTKVGCDRGECGSCNIVVDGKAHLACTMMAIESEGKQITTIEGLAKGSTLHPVQKLFFDNNTFQCGYCTPGMIMTSVALLSKTPKPTIAQVKEALAGNLCYCGDYTRIIKTVAQGIG